MNIGTKIIVFTLIIDICVLWAGFTMNVMPGTSGTPMEEMMDNHFVSKYISIDEAGYENMSASPEGNQTQYFSDVGESSSLEKQGTGVISAIGDFTAFVGDIVFFATAPVTVWGFINMPDFARVLVQSFFAVANLLFVIAIIQFLRGAQL